MVIESGRPLIESPCVPRVRKSELLKIEMVAELVAERM
jgi:hypothetical protein